MVNHFYDPGTEETRCQNYSGVVAFHVSCNDRVSCPDCLDRLTVSEKAVQFYG